MQTTHMRTLAATALAAALVLGAGTAVVQAQGRGPDAAPPVEDIAAATVDFPVNERGLTYGSELDAPTPELAPDLIAAYTTNGVLGYVLKTDLHPPLPASPTEALAAQEAASSASRTIPVFAQDGITRIGSYEILPGSEGAPVKE